MVLSLVSLGGELSLKDNLIPGREVPPSPPSHPFCVTYRLVTFTFLSVSGLVPPPVAGSALVDRSKEFGAPFLGITVGRCS